MSPFKYNTFKFSNEFKNDINSSGEHAKRLFWISSNDNDFNWVNSCKSVIDESIFFDMYKFSKLLRNDMFSIVCILLLDKLRIDNFKLFSKFSIFLM